MTQTAKPKDATSSNSDTKLERIKAFNAKHNATIPPPPPDDKTKTTQEKIADKAKQKTAEELAQEQEDLLEEQRKQQIDAVHQLTMATSTIIDRVNERVNPLKSWIANQPTPGGIAALLIFIGFFALVVIPVNDMGQTRAYLLWQTLLNRTHMKYRESINPGGGSVSGASGDFGPGGASGNFGTNGASGDFGTGTIPGAIDLTHLNLFRVE